MQKMHILMLGESLERQGGIVSVEKLILQQAPIELQISHIPTLPKGSALAKVLVFCQALGKLFWQLFRKEAEMVHIHVSDRGSAFRQAITTVVAYLLQKPVILHTHSADFHIFYSRLPKLIQSGLSWAFSKATYFIVLSESWKKYYTDYLGLKTEQVIVLPNPVKFPEKVPARISHEKVRFLFLGRIGERKGAFDLIKAFAAMPLEKQQNAHLTIAGDGEGERARNLVAKLNLSQFITILDWVNEKQRDELLEKADVFVLPSYNEGQPMALLEAMSWQLPVITAPVGGIPELIISQENGLLVHPGQILDLSKAMQCLIDNPELRQTLGEKARLTVEPFALEKYLISLKELYHSLSR